tara:strand:- start:1148 stop:3208 length:2061 start_codon:yes stop_codon:yes gene_type:complete
MVPDESAWLALKPMLDGYLTCRSVSFSHASGDALRMFNSETVELQHAFDGIVPNDGSLPPRHVAITLLFYGKCGSTMPKTYLDALAHFASAPISLCNSKTLGATIIRMSVLADFEADWFATKTKREACSTHANAEEGSVQMCVRWMTKAGMRCEFQDLPAGLGLDEALATMKNFLISMKVQHDAPISDNVCVSHGSVGPDAWITTLHRATVAFSHLMEGVPHISKCSFCRRFHDIDIDDVHIYVRISERARGDAGLNDASAFHGFLVGNSAFVDEIRKHCASHTELPSPDEETEKYCLHTCAVQTQVMPLGTRVSTYAQGGMCTQPFSSSGNWIYRLDPAIVPIEDVLKNFVITPCSIKEVMPKDTRLEKPMRACMDRAYKLFCSIFGSRREMMIPGAELEAHPLCVTTPAPQDESKEEAYARTAFGVDMSSRRVFVGDAYNILSAQNAPPQLTSLFLQSAMRFGVNTPILDCMGLAASSLAAFTSKVQQEADIKERNRYRRVSDGVLLVRAKRAPVDDADDERKKCARSRVNKKLVNSLLTISGISKTCGKAVLPDQSAPVVDFGVAATMLSEALITPAAASEAIVSEAAATAKSARNYGAVNAVAAACAVFRATSEAVLCAVFLLHHVNNTDNVVIYEVLSNGATTASSPGLLLERSPRRVFIVRENDGCAEAELVSCSYTHTD